MPPPLHTAGPGSLWLLQAPGVEEEHGVEAAQFLWQLVGGNRRLTAYVERRERLVASGKHWGAQAPTKLHLTLMEPGNEDYSRSVAGQLLSAGLARLVEPKGAQVDGVAAAVSAPWCRSAYTSACCCCLLHGLWRSLAFSSSCPLPSCPCACSLARRARCWRCCARARRRRGGATSASTNTATPAAATRRTTAASPR